MKQMYRQDILDVSTVVIKVTPAVTTKVKLSVKFDKK